MPEMQEMAVEAEGLRKRFGRRQVLDGLSLSLRRGESMALVGLNGAGKTTLLRCLLDFQRPDAGSARIDGRSTREPAARADLAFLPERFLAPEFLTGREFLRFSARLHGKAWDADEARQRCAALALSWEELGTPVGRLSKGTAQKLGLAACLLSGKRLYILDEPLSGLDVQARVLAMQQLFRLREEGCTLLFTCHEPADIDVLCHRVALLGSGRLHFCDTPQALRARFPADTLDASVLACLSARATAGDRAADPPGSGR